MPAGADVIMDLSNDMHIAVEALYEAFADVKKPQVIEGCPCCYEGKQVDVLLSTPLREIGPDMMARYAFSAFKTIGSLADYLYFLPRILEISSTLPLWWPEIEVTGRAVGQTRPQTWRPDRLLALEALLTAKVSECLEQSREGISADAEELNSWLCAMDLMGVDLMPKLRQIETSPPLMAALYCHHAEKLAKGRLNNAFWENSSPGYAVMRAWFSSSPVRTAVYERLGIILPSATQEFA